MIITLIIFVVGCGYAMYYTKTITPVPSHITPLKVMEIKDVKVSGKANYVRSILLSELLASKRFTIDEHAKHHLIVSIDGYRAGYRKYIALSGQIVDASTNKVVWSAAISGVSKKYIDEVVKNVAMELVKEMSGLKK